MRSLRSLAALLTLATCAVPAAAQTVRTVAVTPAADTLTVGDSLTLAARATAASGKPARYTLAWSVRDPRVASVTRRTSTLGAATAVAVARDTGTTMLYATANGVTGRALLTVRAKPAPTPIDTASRIPEPTSTPGDSADGARRPALPREWVPPTVVPLRRYRVATDEAFQAALDSARAGDELRLTPGRVYAAHWWTIQRAAAGGYVTITTDLPDSLLPAPGTVPTLAQAARFAVLATTGQNEPALRVGPGARGWRFLALRFDALPAVRALNTLVFVGAHDGNTRVTDAHPSDLIFDRVAVTPHDSLDTVRGMLLNGARVAVLASRIFVHGGSSDAMAIGCWTVCQQITLQGNSITGNGHYFISGGADPADSTLLPRDLVFRGNRFWRPESWRGVWPVKTCLELKIADRVLIEGNVFENHWTDAQSGFCLLFKSVDQYGTAPWSQTRDVTVRRNIVRASSSAFNLAANPEPNPALDMVRVRIEDNLVYDLDGRRTTGGLNGRVIQMGGVLHDVAIVGNTLLNASGAYTNSGLDLGVNDPVKATGISFRRNVLALGEYGVQSALGIGTTAFTALAGSSWRADGNVFVGLQNPARYPAGSRFLDGLGALGLPLGADPTGYQFPVGSPYAGVGADLPAVLQATAGARAIR